MSDVHNAPPPAPPSPPPAPPAPPAPPRDVADPSAEIARLRGDIANVRAEAAAYRVDGNKAREQVAVSEARIAELQQEAARREEAARAAGAAETNTWKAKAMDAEIKAAALAAGLVDPDLVPLISKTGVTVEADGTIKGIPEAIAAFKTAKPNYFRGASAEPPPPPAPPAPPRAPGSPAPSPTPHLPLPDIKGMSRADYDKAKRQAIASLRHL
jgi:hypothetical protein